MKKQHLMMMKTNQVQVMEINKNLHQNKKVKIKNHNNNHRNNNNKKKSHKKKNHKKKTLKKLN